MNDVANNKKTDCDIFRVNLDETLTLSVRLRAPIKINSVFEQLTNNIIQVAKAATSVTPTGGYLAIAYSMEFGI